MTIGDYLFLFYSSLNSGNSFYVFYLAPVLISGALEKHLSGHGIHNLLFDRVTFAQKFRKLIVG